jgi:hypothetical protein
MRGWCLHSTSTGPVRTAHGWALSLRAAAHGRFLAAFLAPAQRLLLVCVVPDCQYAGFSPTSMLHPATKEQVAYMRLWRQGCLRLVNHTGHSATAILIGYFEFKRMNNNWWWVQRMNNNWWLALWVAGSWREFESCILLVLTVVVPNKFCSSFVVSHRA